MQTTLTLNHLDIRTSALALAEVSRRRPRGEETRETGLSRNLARLLEESYPVAVARGEVVIELSDESLFLLGTCLNRAAQGSAWYGSRVNVPTTSFRALAARLEA